MAINITPRGYNVDPTGADYVLDPEPLLSASHRAFANQQENIRRVGEVSQMGVQLGEFIGARQQLGRVKAALGEIDPSDPLFARKYSAVVAENPLAFTNERIAPVTKATVTPLLSAASQAMQDRAALERAQVMAGMQRERMAEQFGYQQSAADAQAGRQREFYDHQLRNPRLSASASRGANDDIARIIGGFPRSDAEALTDTRPEVPARPGAELPVDGPDAALFGGPNLLPGPGDTPEGPPFIEEGVPVDGMDGQGDSNSGITVSNGVMTSPTGKWKITNLSAGGARFEPLTEASKPDIRLAPGFELVPGFNPDGSVSEWRLERTPAVSATEIAQNTAQNDAIARMDSEYRVMSREATDLDARAAGLKEQALRMLKDDPDRLKVDDEVGVASAAARLARGRADARLEELKFMEQARNNPAFARRADAFLRERRLEREGSRQAMDVLGGPISEDMEDLILGGRDSPAPDQPLPLPALSARDQLAAQRGPSAKDVKWDEEKRVAVTEARRIERELGLTPDSFLKAVAAGDSRSVRDVVRAAYERKIESPFFTRFISQESLFGPSQGYRFKRSEKLGRGWDTILRAAARDPNYNTAPVNEQTSGGRNWGITVDG